MTDALIEKVARAIHTGLGDISVSGSRHAARAAIAAIEASGTHRVVPMVPTELMVDGFIGDLIGTQTFMQRYTAMIAAQTFMQRYTAMLAAAPKVLP